MIKTANFQKASDLAYDILMEHSTGTLPIDIFKIIRHNFPEIILMTFTEELYFITGLNTVLFIMIKNVFKLKGGQLHTN